MSDSHTFDKLHAGLTKRLKSLIRERQRIWQIIHQETGDIVITLSRGTLKTVFRGTVRVNDAMRTYLTNLDEEITLLTGWVANPGSIPPAVIISHYLYTKYFH